MHSLVFGVLCAAAAAAADDADADADVDTDSGEAELSELHKPQHIIKVPDFSPVSSQLRQVFDDRWLPVARKHRQPAAECATYLISLVATWSTVDTFVYF